MVEHPFRPVTHERPIATTGARITGDVVVDGGRSNAPLTIACTTIDGAMRFSAGEMNRPLRLTRVNATKAFVLDDIRSESDVLVERSELEAVQAGNVREPRNMERELGLQQCC